MTSMLSGEESNTMRMKQKLMRNAPAKEETRSFLNFSRENLSISHSDLEQGFNWSWLIKPSRNTILSVAALIAVVLCLGLQSWKLLSNTREIEQLRRDVDILKHRFLEQDLMDELKAFEKQLYAEESTEDNDPGEADIDNADYDSNYDDDGSASHDYSGDYHTPLTYGARPSDFLDITSTSIPIPTSSDPGANEDMVELLAALRKVEAKHGQNFERDHKRSVNDDSSDDFMRDENGKRHNTRRIVSRARSYANGENKTNDNSGTNSTLHPPKKYHVNTLETIPSARHDRLSERITQPDRYENENTETVSDRRISWRNRDTSRNKTEIRQAVQNHEVAARENHRRLTRRHLRAPRQVYAIHYGADSTLFSTQDEHTGNGRVRHYDGVFRAWKPSEWVTDLGMSRHFTLAGDGKLSVHEPGLYLVYAQIHYLDRHDENGFRILMNGRSILQCMVYSPGIDHKSRSCFSAQVIVLQAGDHLVLKDIGAARFTLFHHDKSFFGLVKIGESIQQQRHP
ncbi:EIGER protein, partial [Pseudoatta argentina]